MSLYTDTSSSHNDFYSNDDASEFITYNLLTDSESKPFAVRKSYISPKVIGNGAQGIVVSAKDTINKRHVAIKKLQYNTANEMKKAEREVDILKLTQDKNIISLVDLYSQDDNALYIVMELMDGDLTRIKGKLNHYTVAYLIYQLLNGLHTIHSKGIMHRDLKPKNIGVSRDGRLKILDFGLSCSFKSEDSIELSKKVGTRNYEAPEVLLGLPYTEKADIWSIGCIAAEIVLGSPIFPGLNAIHQWETILKVLGSPDYDFTYKLELSQQLTITNSFAMQESNLNNILSDGKFVHKTPDDVIKTGMFRNLLEQMFQYDYNNRITAEQALQHPYFKDISKYY